ncbi:MFS transporter [Streptomyces sp. NPDC048172]|uniref:MFS transporter n=1 Tax=Streptomyces sp. NPDC048172 TaxID=3365505 RepID=UPI00371ADAA8
MTTPHRPGPPPSGGILAQYDFRQLFHAAAVSHFGTHVTLVALPLIATLQLDASAFEVGLLTAVETVAFLLIGLPAGAWVDRARKLPVLLRADLVRAVAMGSVPVAAVCDALTMAQLYAVALVTGFGTVFFDVAYQSYLPWLLPRSRLVAGNGALESARSAAQVAGPGLGGGLVQALGAPLALLVDALSYLVSAFFLRRIRVREEAPVPEPGVSLGAQVKEGLAFVLRHPVLRLIAATTGIANFFAALQTAVQTVFLVRVLDLPAGGVGLTLSASAVGGLLGAACAGRLARWCGQIRLIWLAPVVTGPFAVLWPLSGKGFGAVWFAVASGAVYFGAVVYNVAQVSYRQAVCPEALLGRMNATLRFMVWGSMPLGALAGGALASAAGPRTALWLCAAGFLLVPLPLLPLRRKSLRDAMDGALDADSGDEYARDVAGDR